MVEVKIKGTVSPNGQVAAGEGFKVVELGRHASGWKRFRVKIESIELLASVESVKSTSKRATDAGDPAAGLEFKARPTIEKIDPPKKSFVVVSGYTRPPHGKPAGGHHGFSFVAVGESPGC
ncbi:hypothetical protein [Engelhardtia mirabilis]|uniref:Uncharacterized protein n=1 Tax=Engelhardtia mirabilis TaxID=2528011 RepID=A0A518BSI1_9BACT|nr:hypothetical protein Pla133_50560 [Planctomycetes bacterium Pla133]QDV04258.1 hypothetical protein Pla86_50530 [Planctomycetes bacterium Pla86]